MEIRSQATQQKLQKTPTQNADTSQKTHTQPTPRPSDQETAGPGCTPVQHQSQILLTPIEPQKQWPVTTFQAFATETRSAYYYPHSAKTLKSYYKHRTLEVIRGSSDGACRRGNDTVRCSIGVYLEAYDHPLSQGIEISDLDDSHQAELAGAIALTRSILDMLTFIADRKKPKVKAVVCELDGASIVEEIMSGRIVKHHKRDRLGSNRDKREILYAILRECVEKIGAMAQVTFVWKPRHKNQEADEFCNAALDKRKLNKTIQSPQSHVKIHDEDLMQIVELLPNAHHPTIKLLAHELNKMWAAFIHSILVDTDDAFRARLLFYIAPHLLTTGRKPFIQNRQDFRKFRTHIHMLQDPQYLAETIRRLKEELEGPLQQPTQATNKEKSKEEILSLCKRGLFSKPLKQTKTQPADMTEENVKKVAQSFPQADPPTPFDIPAAEVVSIDFDQILRATLKLAAGRSPAFTGWTKELLQPCLTATLHNTGIQLKFVQLFQTLVNANIPEREQHFIKTFKLSPFTYQDKQGKIRAILMPDTIMKVAWNIVIEEVQGKDKNIQLSGMVYSKPGNCQLATHTVQAALNEGRIVVSLDAQNAFPTLSRQAIFDYCLQHKQIYRPMMKFTNMWYGGKSTAVWARFEKRAQFTISSGSFQGCTSGSMFYALGTMNSHLLFPKALVQVADDINVINEASLHTALAVIAQFKTINQALDGKKMKIIVPQTRRYIHNGVQWTDDQLQNFIASNEILQRAELVTTPTLTLGTVISPNLQSEEDFLALVKDKLHDWRETLQRIILMNASLQCKLLILRHATWKWTYLAQTMNSHHRTLFFNHIQQLAKETLFHFFPEIKDEAHHVRIHSATEDGGLGFFPWSDLHATPFHISNNKASAYARQFDLLLPEFDDEPSLLSKWAKYAHSRRAKPNNVEDDLLSIAQTRIKLRSWLLARPMSQYLQFDDDEMRFAVAHRFDVVPRFNGLCTSNQNMPLSSLPDDKFAHHIQACATCAPRLYWRRHQQILYTALSTFKHHALNAFIPAQQEFPLPNNERGGPDLIAYVRQGHADALDFTVVSISPRVAFDKKIAKYQMYENLTNHTSIPIVVTRYGIIAKQTRELIEKLWLRFKANGSFLLDFYNNIQFAAIRATRNAILELLVQNQLAIQHQQWLTTANPNTPQRTQNIATPIQATPDTTHTHAPNHATTARVTAT